MIRTLALLAAGAALTPVATGLVRGSIQTQRLGPGAAYPPMTRPFNPVQGRRSFMRWVLVGGLAVAAAESGLAFLRFFWSNRTEAFGAPVLATTLDKLPPVGGVPLRNASGRFYLLQNQDGLIAFHWKCTHLGCTVPWNKDEGQFHCPCHTSLFNRQGLVVGGPAPRPLDVMPITIEGNAVIVDTGTIMTRTDFSPDQMTRV